MNAERPLTNKRSFTGYSSMSVVAHIQAVQEKYQKELNNLKENLIIEKEMNQKLKIEIEIQQSLPETNPIEEEISPMLEDLLEQHMMNTKSVLDAQNEFKAQELTCLKELEIKKQQRDMSKKRLQEALLYFKPTPITPSEFAKEQGK